MLSSPHRVFFRAESLLFYHTPPRLQALNPYEIFCTKSVWDA